MGRARCPRRVPHSSRFDTEPEPSASAAWNAWAIRDCDDSGGGGAISFGLAAFGSGAAAFFFAAGAAAGAAGGSVVFGGGLRPLAFGAQAAAAFAF